MIVVSYALVRSAVRLFALLLRHIALVRLRIVVVFSIRFPRRHLARVDPARPNDNQAKMLDMHYGERKRYKRNPKYY